MAQIRVSEKEHMLYLRLNHGGMVELPDAETAEREDEELVLRALDGHIVCRINRMDVLAFSRRRDVLEQAAPDDDD
jgi:hypothetical protein